MPSKKSLILRKKEQERTELRKRIQKTIVSTKAAFNGTPEADAEVRNVRKIRYLYFRSSYIILAIYNGEQIYSIYKRGKCV